MATWTQADIDQLKAAIKALSAGQAAQQVRFDTPTGSRSVTYHPTDLEKMRSLLAEMQADVAASAGTRPFRRLASRTGF